MRESVRGVAPLRECRLFARSDALVFACLTALQFGAFGGLAGYWLLHGTGTATYLLPSILLGGWLLLWESRWLALPLMARPPALVPRPGLRVAAVTTIVPSKEPLAMLETTVEALVAMRYPHDTWVLDEEGMPAVEALCERLGARYFTRATAAAVPEERGPFAQWTKHGNYNVWLTAIGYRDYDVLVAFDPDHAPRQDYLLRTLGHFRDPKVGYVQPAPGFYNQSASFVARGAAEETYTYWSATVMAAYGAGHVTVNGSHNVHRVSALKEVGGFADHDGDDHVLVLRYRANGWRGVYVPEHLALGTSPVSWPAYLRQQRRWARSLVDIKLRVLPRLLPHLPWPDRVAAVLQGSLFLSGAAIPLVVGVTAAWLARGSGPVPLERIGPYIAASLVAILLCEGFRQRFAIEPRERGFHWRGLLLRFAKWPYLTLAVTDALHGRRRPYELTEKLLSPDVERLAPAIHLGTALLVGSAWGAGMLSGGIEDAGLHVVAALLVGISLLAACATGRSVRAALVAPSVVFSRLLESESEAAPLRRRRILAAKVFRVSLDAPLTPLEVEDRYREALLVVQSHGAVIGRVWLPATSVIPVEVQLAAIADELGSALWQQYLRMALESATPNGASANGKPQPLSSAHVSVVICTHERVEQLQACLESLLTLTTPPLEVIVVDNAPKGGETRALCERYPVRYVLEERPGTAGARNRGIREAKGDFIAFTDDDCVVDPHWLDRIDRQFADPLVMAVTGPIEPLELETSAQYLIEIHGVFTRIDRPRIVDGLAVDPVSAPYHTGATANMVLRRKAFVQAGLFPEDFGAGTPILTGEDPYVLYRLLAAGYRIAVDPAQLVWHQHRREYDGVRKVFFSYTLAMLAHCLRCLVRHREPAALRPFAWSWLRHFPSDLSLIVRRDDRRITLDLLLAEVAGAIVAPWRLIKTTLARTNQSTALEPRDDWPAAAASIRVGAEPPPTVSVVIPSYNRREPLKLLLEGLRSQTYPFDRFETVVVVDGSTDGSALMARSLDVPYTLRVVEQENSGASAARNRGVGEAAAPVVVFLDDDIVPNKSFLAEHAAAHSGTPQVAIGYCPPVIEEKGLWALSLRAWWEDHYRRKAEAGHHWTWIDLTVGNLSLPRDVFLDSGGLDPDFKSRGREDWELGIRLLKQGVSFTYLPRAAGMHYIDTRFSTRLRQMRQEARDDLLLGAKHPEVMGQLLLAEVARRIAGGDTWLLRAYSHAEFAARAAQLGPPVLTLLERLRLRAPWRRLTRALLAHAYMRGVADVVPTPEQFISLFAPVWNGAVPARVPVFLDQVELAYPIPVIGSVELELGVRQQPVARFSTLEGASQWGWEEVADRVLRDESWSIMQALVRDDLLSAWRSNGSAEHREEGVRAG